MLYIIVKSGINLVEFSNDTTRRAAPSFLP